ncbi:DUF4386 domain-containing protein [Thiomicrorhabdus sp. zzn3]|uniref:DUF4386 domain-containing protein n=1 Tax=Thiomicrorhabdus sp. zzn3 TaxID=3039775 RepID=UPI002436624E|nr:DUF4386 domain-containing protein [Thiomicrorhabdus sp. zzn3]MDG6778113.1 DUF4386 domain-containing protein [Thiomicrorhabdus sp. zzn3]
METKAEMNPYLQYARLAGILYLIIIVCGIGSEVFIRSNLIVAGDAAATTTNILGSQGLFRLGFAADAIMLLSDVAIAVLFYLMFKPVNQTLSLMAAAFRLMQAAIIGVNLLSYYAAMLLLNGAGYGMNAEGGLGDSQVQNLLLMTLDVHGHGYDLGLIFFGVSSLILGYLMIKSSYFPKLLGYGLIAAAAVYLLGSFSRFLFAEALGVIEPLYGIPLMTELALCLWLLIKGSRLAH